MRQPDTFDLERDLFASPDIVARVRGDETFAQSLYATLCNNQFVHEKMSADHDDEFWSCTWRYAGGIVASIRDGHDSGEDFMDYLDYYCSGNEGHVDPAGSDLDPRGCGGRRGDDIVAGCSQRESGTIE